MKKEFLSPEEFSHLQIFINDPLMKQAVRKVLTAGVYYAGTLQPGLPVEERNFAFACLRDLTQKDRSDEEAGRILRLIAEAQAIVEDAFREIDKLKESKEETKQLKNNAR